MTNSENVSAPHEEKALPNVLPFDVLPSFFSQETRRVVEIVCFAGLTAVVCVTGIPANAVSGLVFWRQGLRDRNAVCLLSLALVDCFHLVFDFVIFPVSSFTSFYDKVLGEEYYLKTSVMLLGVSFAFRSASGCITMVIAIERCVCVASPLHASSLMKTRTMGVMMIMLVVTLQLLHLISPASIQAVCVNTDAGSQWLLVPTQFSRENPAFTALANSLLTIAVPMATFTVVTLTTALTLCKLAAAMRWREKISSASRDCHNQQRALTKMLLFVSCVYIISMAPFVASSVTRFFVADYSTSGRHYNMFMAVNAIVNVFPRINSSIDFFIYFSHSSRFRTELRIIFGLPRKPLLQSCLTTRIAPRDFTQEK